ncbi:hypothetical protein CAL7102_01927 [Dulcicalothrix desertica PCC 7102]|nr:hypothetical protein CAL7102_01927 [Dulcicalothrix desertica PCC 7102]
MLQLANSQDFFLTPDLKTIKDRVNQHDLEIQFLKQELLGELSA